LRQGQDHLAAFGARAAAFGHKELLDSAIADLELVIKADPKNAVRSVSAEQ
jgi:hypothetical protein